MNHRALYRLIAIFDHALLLSRLSIGLGYLAIGCFLIFGTLGSTEHFAGSLWVYVCFYFLPYIFIGLSLPISLYHCFLLYRYRIIQTAILLIILSMGGALLLTTFLAWLYDKTLLMAMAGFLALMAWLAMPFLFKTNLKRYLDFLHTQLKAATDD